MTIWSSPDAWSTLRKPAGRNTRPLLSAFASMLPKNLIYSYIITRMLIYIIICVQNYTIFPTFHHFSPLFFRFLYFFYFRARIFRFYAKVNNLFSTDRNCYLPILIRQKRIMRYVLFKEFFLALEIPQFFIR